MSMALPTRAPMMARSGDFPLDAVLVSASLILVCIGLVMVASASSEIAARTYGNSFYLLIKHAVYLLISFGCALAALLTPVSVWKRFDVLLLVASFALLIAVQIPGVGHKVNGSTRWISLGFFTLQGSELVKLFFAVYIAGYLVRRQEEVQNTIVGFIKPLAVLSVIVLLLLEQPDFGAAVVIMTATMGMVFLADVPFKRFLPIITLVLIGIAVIAQWQPYRLERLTTFANPWEHQFGSGYQLTQALIAFGRGEVFGLGLGNSIQKLFYLPEAHTDFLFSITAEELGVVGALTVIVALGCLVIRAFRIGQTAQTQQRLFEAYLAYGIAILLGSQSLINIGVNIGLLPTKGLTLPLVSYGGNSLIITCVMIAVLLRIDLEARLHQAETEGGKRRGR
ncbi:MAG: putative lipid II flippase FtsW [Pseudomonadales bacterium]|nr:putative lipid II flippase FtsW [Pseudomonadales bacterium]